MKSYLEGKWTRSGIQHWPCGTAPQKVPTVLFHKTTATQGVKGLLFWEISYVFRHIHPLYKDISHQLTTLEQCLVRYIFPIDLLMSSDEIYSLHIQYSLALTG